MKKAIWIDVDNSPHVPLFAPLVKFYREAGVEVVLTARNHAQTIELLENAGFGGTFEVIGRHYGKNKFNKVRGLLVRAKQLVSYINQIQKRGVSIKVAVSHGSRSMVLAARWLKIPVLTMYDYEFTETTIFNRFSDKVLVPEAIPDETLDRINLPVAKRVKYRGLKESLYLTYYRPTSNFWRDFTAENGLDISDEQVLIALRPPATTANYHHTESELLLRELLKYFLRAEKTFTIILPRTAQQKAEIEHQIKDLNLGGTNYFIIERAINGLDLALKVDLLVSGGGTMNREAALLETPVYSIFAGKQGALDAAMEKTGQITFIRTPGDISKIKLEKKGAAEKTVLTEGVESCVKEQINYYLKKEC
jgi:predicted glycosyltransferase